MKPTQLLASTLITGSVASVVSTVTLAALAKMEGKPAAQPLNSTSHWFYGDNAARVGGVDATLLLDADKRANGRGVDGLSIHIED
jgi:hypothetical protein